VVPSDFFFSSTLVHVVSYSHTNRKAMTRFSVIYKYGNTDCGDKDSFLPVRSAVPCNSFLLGTFENVDPLFPPAQSKLSLILCQYMAMGMNHA